MKNVWFVMLALVLIIIVVNISIKLTPSIVGAATNIANVNSNEKIVPINIEITSSSLVGTPVCEEAKICDRGVQDSCGSIGGQLDSDCKCSCVAPKQMINGKCQEDKKEVVRVDSVNKGDCNEYASYVQGTDVSYVEGLQHGLSNEEACKSYAYQDVKNSHFCNKFVMQQLYAYFKDGCCARTWVELPQQVYTPDAGMQFCGYKLMTTNQGIWRKVTGGNPSESVEYTTWLPQFAAVSEGESCAEVISREGGLSSC